MDRHLVVLLREGQDEKAEWWRSPGGEVVLFRPDGEREWRLVVDRMVLAGAEAGADPASVPEAPRSEDPEALLTELAMRENLHALFDR